MSFLNRLAPRDRRAVLLGLLVLAPGLIWVLLVKPYRAMLDDLSDRARTQRGLLERERALIAQASILPDSLSALNLTAARANARLVEAANPALAETELTAYLENAAVQSRVLLKAIRSIDAERGAKAPSGVAAIRLSLSGESDLTGMLSLLQRLERGKLLVNVKELSIQPTREPGENPGAVSFAIVMEAYTPSDGATKEAPARRGTS